MDINEQAHEMLEQLIESMKKSEGITETLKSSSQLEWIQRMNSIKHRAEILIQKELIFTWTATFEFHELAIHCYRL